MYNTIFFDRKKRIREERIAISSKIENLNLVEKFIEDVCNTNHIDNNYFATILMAVTTAVENAIIHGNKNDSDKIVNISFEYCQTGGIAFTVSDQGEGFDYTKVINPIESEQETQSGRGIFLINNLSDAVTFRNNGAEIEMIFVIDGISPVCMQERISLLGMYSEQIKQQIAQI